MQEVQKKRGDGVTCPALKPPDTFAEVLATLGVLKKLGIPNPVLLDFVEQELRDLHEALALANKHIEKLSKGLPWHGRGTVQRCFGCHKYGNVVDGATDGSVVCSKECFKLVKRSDDPAWKDPPGAQGATCSPPGSAR